MTDLALSLTTGDLVVQDGDLTLLDGGNEIAQQLFVRYQTFLGEWKLDERVGIPYFTDILGKPRTEFAIRAILLQVATTTPGVTAVNGFDLDTDEASRALRVSFQADTERDGTIVFDQEFILNV